MVQIVIQVENAESVQGIKELVTMVLEHCGDAKIVDVREIPPKQLKIGETPL